MIKEVKKLERYKGKNGNKKRKEVNRNECSKHLKTRKKFQILFSISFHHFLFLFFFCFGIFLGHEAMTEE